MNELLKVTGQVNAALVSLAADQPDVADILDRLPQVVVIGSQSVGKSTLLEAFINMEILPKAKDKMVTRRPIVISLVTAPSVISPTVIFKEPRAAGVQGNVPISNEAQIVEYLEAENMAFVKDAGNPAGVSPLPIRLTVRGRDLPTLTIIDLPGLIVGYEDYPQTVSDIREMVLQQVKEKPNVLMLAVVDGSLDKEMQHGHQTAKEVDPKQLRTITVHTKMDRAQADGHAWNAVHKAAAGSHPLNVGVMLKRDAKPKTLPEGMWQERQWFAKNSPPGMANLQNVGVHYLLSSVQAWLIPRINDNLSDLRENVKFRLDEARAEYTEVMADSAQIEDAKDISIKITGLCGVFDVAFFNVSMGTVGSLYRNLVNEYTSASMTAGLEEQLALAKAFAVIDAAEGINEAIDESGWSDKGCRRLAEAAASSFLKPAEECLDKIQALLVRASRDAVDMVDELRRFSALKQKMLEAAQEAIQTRKEQALEDVKNIIAKHERLLDERAMGKMKSSFEQQEATAESNDFHESIDEAVRGLSKPMPDSRPGGSLIPPEEMALKKAKVAKNVKLTANVVRAYIKQEVQKRLAFDIPASWRLFMLYGHPCDGLLNQQRRPGSTGGLARPRCYAQQCSAKANLCFDANLKNTRQGMAAAAELHALVKETDEIEQKRKQLAKKVVTLEAALKDLESARAVEVPGAYEPMQPPSGEAALAAEPVKPQLTEADMQHAVEEAQAKWEKDSQRDREREQAMMDSQKALELAELRASMQQSQKEAEVQQAVLEKRIAEQTAAEVQQKMRDREEAEQKLQAQEQRLLENQRVQVAQMQTYQQAELEKQTEAHALRLKQAHRKLDEQEAKVQLLQQQLRQNEATLAQLQDQCGCKGPMASFVAGLLPKNRKAVATPVQSPIVRVETKPNDDGTTGNEGGLEQAKNHPDQIRAYNKFSANKSRAKLAPLSHTPEMPTSV